MVMDPRARAVLASVLILAAGCASSARRSAPGESALDARSRAELAERVVSGWSEKSRLAARLMIKGYGSPDEVGSARLVWHGNGPWKRTIVRDLPMPYAWAEGEDLGVIEQSVSYRLTPEQAAAAAPLSDRLACDAEEMEMSSRSDREELNILRLNLANDVVRRLLTVEEARDAYARTLALEAAGKTQRYVLGLRFGYAP